MSEQRRKALGPANGESSMPRHTPGNGDDLLRRATAAGRQAEGASVRRRHRPVGHEADRIDEERQREEVLAAQRAEALAFPAETAEAEFEDVGTDAPELSSLSDADGSDRLEATKTWLRGALERAHPRSMNELHPEDRPREDQIPSEVVSGELVDLGGEGRERTLVETVELRETAEPWLPLIPLPKGKDSGDRPIAHVLSEMGAAIKPGQKAFLQLSLRHYPTEQFKHNAEVWLAEQRGEREKTRDGRGGKLILGLQLLFWVAGRLLSSLFTDKQHRGPAAPPPWRRAPEPFELDARTKAKLATVDARLDDQRHESYFDATLRTAVVGKSAAGAERGTARGLRRGADAIADRLRRNLRTSDQKLRFKHVRGHAKVDPLLQLVSPRLTEDFLLSEEEVAQLFHPLDDNTRPASVVVERSRARPLRPTAAPPSFDHPLHPPKGVLPIGRYLPDQIFGMPNASLDRHMLLVGRTGVGKSTLATWLVSGMAQDGYPIVVIDPHGTMADEVARHIVQEVPERIDDLIILDADGIDGSVPAINPMDISDPMKAEEAAEQTMMLLSGSDETAIGPAQQPRAYQVAMAAAMALALANTVLPEGHKLTPLHIVDFLQDKDLRRVVVPFADNPFVHDWFDPDRGRYERATDTEKLQLAGPVETRMGPLRRSLKYRRVFSGRNRIDFSSLINQGSIILLKMARRKQDKKLGELLARVLLPMLLATMDDWGRRTDPETGKKTGGGCRLFIDEAPTVLVGDTGAHFIEILAEARKWDLGAISACQYLHQFTKEVGKGQLANTASKIAFQSTAKTGGSELADAIGGDRLPSTALESLDPYQAYGDLLNGSAQTGPMHFHTLPPVEIDDKDPAYIEGMARVKENSKKAVMVSEEEADTRLKSDRMIAGPKAALEKLIAERRTEQATEAAASHDLGVDRSDEPFGGAFNWGDLEAASEQASPAEDERGDWEPAQEHFK